MLDAGQRAALVTIICAEGSSPREAGARMVVTAEGGFSGTIGGGTLEWQALALAQKLMAHHPEGAGLARDFSLGPDLGQCCGGRVRVLIEAFAMQDLNWIAPLAKAEMTGAFATKATPDPRGIYLRRLAQNSNAPEAALHGQTLVEHHGTRQTPLLLFGAGHVGRALVLALAPLPFSTRWIDPRPDAFPGHHPANVTAIASPDPVREAATAQPGTAMLVMTHSHALDLDLVAAGLANPAISSIGVIGSATKRARFTSRLAALGIKPETIARLACPIGLPGLGKEPASIAAGIAVKLLEFRTINAIAPACAKPRAGIC